MDLNFVYVDSEVNLPLSLYLGDFNAVPGSDIYRVIEWIIFVSTDGTSNAQFSYIVIEIYHRYPVSVLLVISSSSISFKGHQTGPGGRDIRVDLDIKTQSQQRSPLLNYSQQIVTNDVP